jgi:tetratricopeptide (TPR) repeat protein
LRKALRQEPFERYASVDAFADDIRAFLESRPVQARSGDAWYRARKFLRRYREAVAVAIIIAASILAGLYIAAQQRDIAQRRFLQVRHLANKVLALDEVVGGLHSSTKARHEIVAMSQEYLEALGAEAHKDQGLALEIGKAYSLLARAQGISVVANLGQHAQAEESLRKAEIFVEPVLSANPNDRKALLTAARISHDRMILTEIDRRNEEAVAQARKTVQYLDRLLALGELSEGETQTISEFFYHIALAHKNLHLPDDAIRYAHRSIEISRLLPNAQLRVSLGLSMLADLLRITGDLEAALQAIREARIHLEKVRFPSETARRSSWAAVFGREGKILGATSGLSLGRTSEAIVAHQKAFNLVEEWTQNDLQDAWSRLMFASVGRELGDVLRLRDPKSALAVYDHALLRLREVKDNTEARRGEVEILAGSAYALRRLNRIDEAKERIDTAFRLLRETKEYPADRVVPHESAEAALRALADHLAETDQPGRAAEVYEDLLAKLMVSKMDPWNDLRHAVLLSHIYGSLATLHRRIGMRDRGEVLSSLRLELWGHWGYKLPNSSLVRRQLQSARYPFHVSRLPLHNRS